MLYANYAREKLHNLTLVKEASGYPCVLLNSKGKNLKDYRIYGETKYGSNLFNTSSIISNVYPSTTFLSGNQWRGCTFECEPNTTYVVTKKAGETCILCTSTEYPAVGVTINNRIAEHNATRVEIKTTENDNYVTFFFYRNNVDTIPYDTIVESVYISHLPTVEKPVLLKSVGDKTKNLVYIPDITSETGNGTTIDCKLTKPFVVSCQEYPSLIVNSSGVETSIWRIQFKYLDETTKNVWDAHLRDPAQIYNLKINATEENPVISITYRGTYINKGQYGDIQIEYGEEITEYEPYGYKIPVKVNGKNLITVNDTNLSPYQASVEFIDNNTVKVMATSASNSAAMKFVPKKEIILKAGKSYYLSADIVEANNPRTSTVALFSATGSYLKWFPGVYTPTEDVSASIAIYPHNTGTAGDYVIVKNIQIEEGLTATEYEPYREPTLTKIYINEPLRKTDGYADYIDFKNKSVIRNISELTFDGSEAWRVSLFGENNLYYIACTGMKSGSRMGFKSDLFKTQKTGSSTTQPDNTIVFGYGNEFIYIRYNSVTTLDEFKNFLSNNNLTIVYQLEETEIEQITLPQIKTTQGTSFVKTDTNIPASDIWVKYITK